MIFSTYDPTRIPSVNDRVTYDGHTDPWTVTARVKDPHGQVWLQITDGTNTRNERVEVLNWYPTVGDTVVFLLKPYIDWMQGRIDAQRRRLVDEPMKWGDIQLTIEGLKKEMDAVNHCGSWLYQPQKLISITVDGNAQVQANSTGPIRTVPMSTIVVLIKNHAHRNTRQLTLAETAQEGAMAGPIEKRQ